MNQKLWYLDKLDLFKGLSEKDLCKIEDEVYNRVCSAKEVVLGPGTCDRIYILKVGKLEVYNVTPDGKKVIIDILGPGSIFGDLGEECEEETYVESLSESIVCSMEKDKFYAFISKYPEVSERLLRTLFSRLIYKERRISSLASDYVQVKLLKLLIELGEKNGTEVKGKLKFGEKYTHEQLAQMLGVSRQTITTEVNKLERDKIIKRDGKLIILNLDKVLDLVNG